MIRRTHAARGASKRNAPRPTPAAFISSSPPSSHQKASFCIMPLLSSLNITPTRAETRIKHDRTSIGSNITSSPISALRHRLYVSPTRLDFDSTDVPREARFLTRTPADRRTPVHDPIVSEQGGFRHRLRAVKLSIQAAAELLTPKSKVGHAPICLWISSEQPSNVWRAVLTSSVISLDS